MLLLFTGFSPLVIILLSCSIRSQESSKRHSAKPKLNEKEKKLHYLSTTTLLELFGYSVVSPLEFGTGCFCAGLFVYVMSLVFGFIAMIDFAQAPLDKPATIGLHYLKRSNSF